MISILSMAPITSSSSVTTRVEKATNEFLIGPDWTLNMEICDTLNSNPLNAKEVVRAIKKRLKHKRPRVQLLALTLLETMVKNCGEYLHLQIAERSILPEMVKMVKKKTDIHVRDKILSLIGSWHDAFAVSGGTYPQYIMAYEDLRRFGVQFPRHPPNAAPVLTPPATRVVSTPQPSYGMPSSSTRRLGEAMAAEDTLSLSSLNSMRDILELLTDMLQAVDPSDRSAVKDEIVVDLVQQCRINQSKLMQLLGTTGDEAILGRGLEVHDSLQRILAKHDAIASGAPLPPEAAPSARAASEKHESDHRCIEASTPAAAFSETPSAPAFPARTVMGEEDDEEDDFAQLARRHSKAQSDASQNSSTTKSDVLPQEAPSSPAMSNALVPIDTLASVETKDQNIIELLSIVLSTSNVSDKQTTPTSTAPMQPPNNMPLTSPDPRTTFSLDTSYPAPNGFAFNSYVAPWAQPQPQQTQPYAQSLYKPQPTSLPENITPNQLNTPPQAYHLPQQQPQYPQQYQYITQPSPALQPQLQTSPNSYPPPPWAATPGYFSSNNAMLRPMYTYPTPGPTPSNNGTAQYEFTNGEAQVQANLSPRSGAAQKAYIPSYRLFEDLDVFSNGDGTFKPTNRVSPSFAGPTSQNMVGGRK